jgi:hypothetical protein
MNRRAFVISERSALLLWRIYLLLAIFQGMVAITLLVKVGSSAAGISPLRLVILMSTAIFLLIFVWLAVLSWARPARFSQGFARLEAYFTQRPHTWVWTMLISSLLAILGAFFITLVPDVKEPFSHAYFERVLPLVIWLVGLAAQTVIALTILRYGSAVVGRPAPATGVSTRSLYPKEFSFYLSVFAIGVLFLLWSFVAQESSAQEAKITVWGAMGTPLLEWQVLFAWLLGMGMLALMIILPTQADSSKADASKGWLKLRSIRQKITLQRLDLLVGILLWLGSIWLWQSVPLTPNWFVTQPHAPNHEYYPNSDAQYYDITAQNALIGEGYLYFNQKAYVRRPMLALLTLLLHVLGGQDYETVAFLQIILLALIIPLVYFLTRSIHNRISGLIAAVLIMLREANSIALTSRITTSNVKLLMADVPAMLATLGFTLVIITWFKKLYALPQLKGHGPVNQPGPLFYSLLAGGILGIGMLVRPELFLFYAVIAGITALQCLPHKQFGIWVKGMLVFSLGLGLVLAPWIWRNWRITGQFVFDSPIMRLELIVLRYRSADQPEPTPAEGVSPTEALTGATTPVPGATPSTSPDQPLPEGTPQPEATPRPRLKFTYEQFVQYFQEETTNYIRKHPDQILRFVTAHFTHSELQSILILPTTWRGLDSLTAFAGHHSLSRLWEECCSLQGYIRRLPYWRKWDGSFPSQTIIPLIINCLLIASGISETWKRHRLAGITPLLMSSAFYLLHAVFRNSGGRYILPADWFAVVYFSIGLSRASTAVFNSLSQHKFVEDGEAKVTVDEARPDTAPQAAAPRLLLRPSGSSVTVRFYILAVGIFLIGCLLPAVELSIPKRYNEARATRLVEALYQSDLLNEKSKSSLIAFVESGGLIYPGRVLYPNFYPADAYEPGSRLASPETYPRLTFFLVGPISKGFVLPTLKSPDYFPNASDALVFLCPDGKALAAAVFDENGQPRTFVLHSYFQSTLTDPSKTTPWICPLPETPGG